MSSLSSEQRVWTEEELQAEFGSAYNLQQTASNNGDNDENDDSDADNVSVYEDDADYSLPFRFLNHWVGDLVVDGDMNFAPGTVFTGTLMVPPPLPPMNDDNNSNQSNNGAKAALQNIQIQLQPSCFCIDRSPTFRGYWLVTRDGAYYWLHEPAKAAEDDSPSSHQLLAARAVLTCLVNILHYVFRDNNSNHNDKAKLYAKQSIETVATAEPQFNLHLAQMIGGSAARHLIKAHPALTERCAFIKSLQKCGSASTACKKKKQEVLALCQGVEERLPQTTWGQPRKLAPEILQQIQAEQDQDNNDDDDDAMSIGEPAAAAAAAASSKKQRKAMKTTTTTKRSRSRSVTGRAKRPKPQKNNHDSDTDDDDADDDDVDLMNDVDVMPPRAVARGGEQENGRSRRACRRQINYALDDDDDDSDEIDDDDDSVEEKTVPPRGRRGPSRASTAKKAASKNKSKSRKVDSDEEEAQVDASSESEEDLIGVEESFSDESVSSDDEQDKKPRAKQRAKGKAANKSKATAATTTTKGGKEKKKMADSFEPINAPANKNMSLQTIHEEKEFLDNCGMEATDDVIDRLVGDQVDKILALLERSLAEGGSGIGSSQCLLQLGTACSGTDAPALALTIVQEQLEQRGKKNLFQFSHTMSCENEPFKQAYLARNFDSTLYPDIAKLCDDPPRDVYGQEKPIPPFNMFVAGTSCRNFSMQNPTKRIDLEDKGCSGETFFAAVEVLYKFMPIYAIFENVILAPWAKMQEYITGRVKLSDCDSNKSIKDIKDKNAQLTFALDKDKSIVAESVPSVYGIRVGAVVSGFLRPDSVELNKIKWPTKTNKAKECTLNELMKANGIEKKNDTLVFKTPCMYKTQILKVDTKDFGLPQTRMRTYMFVWRPDNDNLECDLGEYWVETVKKLQSPVRHPLQSFILQVDHDIIRVFREALRGPPGRQTMRGVNLEPYFWSGTNSNLRHNKVAREKLGLEDEARFTTNWHAHGKRQVPPHYWLEFIKCNDARKMDLLDILSASALRDAECHDANFSSHYWNISQNASKEKHRAATCGIAGCITPGGDFLLPQEGRPILGCEKLMIQGIPYFRLLLGNETEVQLGDLAGNAMSLTVVCATMLAAITCQQLRKETLESKHQDMHRILAESARGTSRRLCQWDAKENAKSVAMQLSESTLDSFPFFQELANLASEAVKSSIWCTCETSGTNALCERFLECKHCRVTCCRNCVSTTAGYNLASHETSEVFISKEDHDLGRFRSKLLSLAANKALIFTEAGISEIASIGENDDFRVSGLSNYKFCFHDIKRGRKKWHLIYYARENVVEEPIAEYKITIGELKRETIAGGIEVEMGLKGELTSFLPAKTHPLVFGALEACATATVLMGAADVYWDCKGPVSSISLIVKGEGPENSPRVEMGLTDVAANALLEASRKSTNAKAFKEAKSRGEARRWIYPNNWKVWPRQITIEADPSFSLDDTQSCDVQVVCGKYHRSGCRHTTNQSALWVKESTGDNNPTTYILIKPNVHRTGPDKAIVSTSISHEDASCILAVFPCSWDPCDALEASNGFKVENIQLTSRIPLEQMDCLIPASNMTVQMSVDQHNSGRTSLDVSGLSDDDMGLLCRRSVTKLDHMKLDVHSGQRALQTIRDFNGLCVAPILAFTSHGKLASALKPDAPWLPISPPDQSVMFGCCAKTIPPRPAEVWYIDEERGEWNRRTNERASREFYLALQAAPKPFEFWIDKPSGKLSVKIFPEVAAHLAAHQLISGRGVPAIEKQIQVCYRLSDISQQSDPVLKAFKVSNCDAVPPTNITLKSPYQLYQRQQKVVTKMTAIENSNTEFEELELSEHEMPGAVGLSLVARASRKRIISGGVICDAIGSGKTVISIGIILNGLAAARRLRASPERYANETGASLVVVPPALIKQWGNELKKFTEDLNVVEIYSNKSYATITYEKMMAADVVICPIDILESNDKSEDGSNGYMERVLKAAGHDISNIPTLPRYSGQIEQSDARGVWIPATSADPYGGANNGNNQKRRNQSAYFTHTYLSAIQSLREKTFQPTDIVPLEFYSFERVFVDEIHESLCTTKGELKLSLEKEKAAKPTTKDSKRGSKNVTEAIFTEKNRRAGRELLGITQKDVHKRPLQYRRGIFGLTGTPLLDSSSRVIELANLMGNVHVCGLGNHWRQMERESSLDIFLDNYLESKQSRSIRSNINVKCQDYIHVACCRNKTGEEMDGIKLVESLCAVKMTDSEKELYLQSQSGFDKEQRGFNIRPEDFDEKAGHDIKKFLRQNAALKSRGDELVRICKTILSREGDEHTKIIVFTDGKIGAGLVAREALNEAGLGCTFLEADDSVETKNQKISWYQNADATEEDRKRPRVLVLHFDHAAGLNLQTESHDLVLFTPLYIGVGGATSDAVSDASTELQAIGRLFRPGQPNPQVTVWRIEVRGNNDEECLDGQLIRRNTDEETITMAVNGGDD